MKALICSILLLAAAAAAHAAGKDEAKEVTITSKSADAVAAFKHARDLLEGQRFAEGIAELKKAVAADPNFALANAYLGVNTDGPDGQALLDKAVTQSAKLPEAERLSVEILAAQRAGDVEKVLKIQARLIQIVPGDWRVQANAANRALMMRKYDDAVKGAQKAVSSNAQAAIAYNTLAYAYAGQRKWDDAITAAKKQAELLPNEPNPLDTLGEIQLMAGKLADAEASFQKALQVSPKFNGAWQGVAMSRFLRGDWKGGYEALDKGKALEEAPGLKLDWDNDLTLAKAAEGKLDEAVALTAATEKAGEAQKLSHYGRAVLLRGALYYWAGKYAEAARDGQAAAERAEKTAFLGGNAGGIHRNALALEVLAQAKLGKPDDAAKTLALLEAEAKKRPNDVGLQNNVSWGRGAVAMARGDAKEAVKLLSKCDEAVFGCQLELSQAQEKAGDAAGAAETRKKILGKYDRDPMYLIIVAKLSSPAKK